MNDIQFLFGLSSQSPRSRHGGNIFAALLLVVLLPMLLLGCRHYQVKPDVCLKSVSSFVKPTIGSINGVDASQLGSKSNPTIFDYAVVDVEIANFDPNSPPEILVIDEQSGAVLDHYEFAALDAPCKDPEALNVPVFLSYDTDPWANHDKEPLSRTTRIEVHHKLLPTLDKAYAKLHHHKYGGVFVVRVFWHDIVAQGDRDPVDNNHVRSLFWDPPKPNNYANVNAIWAQAGVQFRLMNSSIPFRLASVPTHVLPVGESATAHMALSPTVLCGLGWKADYNVDGAVDIYTVRDLGGVNIAGVGNCRMEGYLLLEANVDDFGPIPHPELIAHEFGHFIASLPHIDKYNKLMHSMAPAGHGLDADEITKARNRIKSHRGFNEDR